MNEQIKKVIEPVKAFWKKQTKKQKTVFFSVLGGIVLVCLVIVVILNLPSYVVLYPGLDQAEAVEVMQLLDDRNVEYRENGGTIMVPEDKEASLRMDLSNAGHPRTGPNYDFFLNNIDIMTTDMEKKIIEHYQLEQKLVAVIKTIDSVSDATVTFTIEEGDGYVLSDQDNKESKAAVTVTLRPGRELSPTQVGGIKHLIANSAPNLKQDNVAIIDSATGSELAGSEATQMDLTKFKMEIEKQFEQDIVAKVGEILTPLYGAKNYQVTAKSTMDIDKKIQEIITYQPSEDNKGVLESEDRNTEATTEGGSIGGIPGAESNAEAETPTYPAGITVDGNTVYYKNDDSLKYLVSQIKEQIQRDSGELKDLTLSVAINQVNMSEQQKADLTKLVAFAASVPVEKVMLYNGAFFGQTPSDPNDPIPADNNIFEQYPWLIWGILGGVFVLLLLFIVLMMISGKRKRQLKKLKELADSRGMHLSALSGQENEDEDHLEKSKLEERLIPGITVKETVEQQLKKEIQDFSLQNPEISAQLIRTWLKGDDMSG